MGISFNDVPTDRLVPFVYVEFDSSRAVQGPGIKSFRNLLIGNKLSTGTKDAEEPIRVSNADQVGEYFGKGSVIHDMARAYFENNQSQETYAVALDDDAAGVKASGSVAFSGTATEDGTVYAYVGGERIPVPVVSGDDGSDVATALLALLQDSEYEHLPVSAARTSGTVNIIAKNKGAHGNSLDLRLNHADGEELPAGLAAVVTQPTSGATNPDIQDAIDALGDTQYDVIMHPWSDDTNMDTIEAELTDRWGPLTQNDGVVITAVEDTFANLATYGDGRNSPHSVVVGQTEHLTPPWRTAAAVGALAGYYGQIDPARPFQTLLMKGHQGPAISDRLTNEERNQLLQAGIATTFVDSSGLTRIERLVTTYKENAFGAADTSYRDLNTVMTLSYLRWDFRNYLLRKYPRHKLAADGTRYAAGQAIVTPSVMRAEAVLKFTEWEALGLVEGFSQFKRDLVVERNASDPNRLDILLPTDLVNQLVVTGVQIQFLL